MPSAKPRSSSPIELVAARLDEAVASFIHFVRSLPSPAVEPSTTDKWGAREVFIHLVFWHEQYASITAALAAKKRPKLSSGTLRESNRRAVEADLATPVEELIARWTKANRRLAKLAHQPGAADLRIPLSEKSKAWPLPVLIRLAAGHIEKHQKKLTLR